MNAEDRGGADPAGPDAPAADALWATTADGSAPDAADGWGSYMLTADGMRVAVSLWERRAEAVAAYARDHGTDQSAWPVSHPPTVLKVPDAAHAACLGCAWLGASCDPDDAHALHRLRWAAQEHSISLSVDV